MKRRDLLKTALAAPFLAGCLQNEVVDPASAGALATKPIRSRVRPGDPAWPTAANWEELNRSVGGQLLKPQSPFANCTVTPLSIECSDALAQLKNPYFIGEQPALTQTSGWVDAWRSQPSAYAVAARDVGDVVAAVRFARKHNLRLVIKGGGHSYQGTSSAPDSLLVWTRHMNDVVLHDDFVARGCEGQQLPQPAVTLGAGAMWGDAYHAVTTQAGRYVQGGGCATVGVAGLVQSGGFGSFSKNYGSVAAGLLEAEIVTADGQVRIANRCTNSDLFWGVKGGGGGSLGVVTRLTLRTRELPETFGGVFGTIRASSEEAYRVLIAKVVDFYQSTLFNRHWGEKIDFTEDSVEISMVFQGLSQEQAQAAWEPLIQWVDANQEYSLEDPFKVLALPARNFWDPEYFKQHAPGVLLADGRPGTPAAHVVWAGDKEQVGWFVHGYKSAWLPAALLDRDRQSQLVDALFASTRHWDVGVHFNKGLAGAPTDEIDAARDTATNPEVLSAFALAIIASSGSPAYAGLPDADPNLAVAHAHASQLDKAMTELLKVIPRVGSYVSESDYFLSDWQSAFWGDNYPKLAAVKQKYDPEGLFFVHHGVGTEDWSEDGFTRLPS